MMGATQADISHDAFEVEGVVKWYDQIRGYGFIVPDEGGADVLLHASCVRAYGAPTVRESDRLTVVAQQTERGLQAAKIVALSATEIPQPMMMPVESVDLRPSDIAAAASPHGALTPARVKWFDKHKGFGFVNVFGDPRDVFVHMETVRGGGLATLQPGEAVLVRTTKGPRGVMVSQVCDWTSINLVDPAPDGNVSRLKSPEEE